MLDWIKKSISKGIWHSLAVIIVVLVAGPEIMMNMELMAIVELFGASMFVLIYASGLKLFLSNLVAKYKKFERHSVFFMPSLPILKQMPSLAFHAIPGRTFSIFFFGFIAVSMSCIYINILIGE
ncbi:hypothetical protein [Gallaecimonas sp. GXIMD1310]|uniref:hypothetical protein n=1 Tax=Gallaecimonas sp. GXIMD1310 TaxID=3131926 RepID=UPI003251BBA2